MHTALLALCENEVILAKHLSSHLNNTSMYVHEQISPACLPEGAIRFSRICDVTKQLFETFDRLVFFAPCGVAVRAIAPHIRDKHTDPAVVVVDAGGRYAISLLSGHEGGANDLALQVANAIGAEPVITTTSEAAKTLIVGIGCRQNVQENQITFAIKEALDFCGASIADVRMLATADIKRNEPGLLSAARGLGIPIRFISSEEIRSTSKAFNKSEVAQRRVSLPAVAEPSALLAGRRTRLILPKTIIKSVTVAIARENCMWSGSDPAVH